MRSSLCTFKSNIQLSTCLAIFLIIATALTSSLVSADDKLGIQVSAEGIAKLSPETALFSLQFENTEASATLAKDSTNKSVKALLNSLKEFSIVEDSIDSGQINVSPSYDYHDGKRTLRGYQVTRSVNFSLSDISQLEAVINAITKAKVSHILPLRFDVNDKQAAHATALQNAISESKRAAQEIANGYGVKLGSIIHVQHSVNRHNAPAPHMRAMAMSAKTEADSSDSYQIKEIEYKAHVTTTFEID